jgi:amino acid transporter
MGDLEADSRRFTYAISLTALIAATAGMAEYWDTPKGIQGGILLFLIPVILVILNVFGIQVRILRE